MNEVAGILIGFILTLFIYSYLIGDNPLYRIAVHLLVGVSAAYAAIVVAREVLWPVAARLMQPALAPADMLWFAPIFFGLLLLLKLARPVAWLGNGAMAVLVGVGAAVALVGAILGTLLPQVVAARYDNLLIGLLATLFTIATLLYFHFTGARFAGRDFVQPFWRRYPALVGRAVLTITFAALFAGLLNTSLILLSSHVGFYIDQLFALLGALLVSS